MKNTKYIHVLLVALLCFSQLAANIHAVGHLHSHRGDLADRSVFVPFSASLSAYTGAVTAGEHHEYQNLLASGESNTENDCGIYHFYSSLNGVLYECSDGVIAAWLTTIDSTYSFVYADSSAVDSQQIRAPPALLLT